MPAMFRGKMGDSLMVNLMPLNEEEKQQLAANPHNANTIVFNRGMNMAKMIGSSARTSKVYTYMKDHYLNLVIVAKDYDDNGARGCRGLKRCGNGGTYAPCSAHTGAPAASHYCRPSLRVRLPPVPRSVS